ncbi:MAG: type II toxin-antitoxin system VapC family toxin [Rhodospirillaceae bacterium]|nr:type II toxin-antitoxin system VapC family toxin [Rhodospirillaceae bacterium]
MNRVIDASVACKWYLDEADSDKARALAEREGLLIAPDLILAEVGNVLWQRHRRGEIAPDHIAAVVAHLPGILVLVPSKDLFARALEFAQALDHPIYDCFYAAAAERWEAPLITDDKKFFAALKKSKIKVAAKLIGAAG